MLNFLEAYLSCTGFDACSLQPTNGAAGEYAGFPGDQKYQESIGQGPRNQDSARNEFRQRSDVAHRHEDQELSSQGVSLEKLMSVQ